MRASPRPLTAAVALLALSVPLAACGSEGDDGDQAQPAITGGADGSDATEGATDDDTTAAPTTAPDGSATAPDDGATDGAPAADANSGLLAAIELAEGEVGGTAFEVDREDDGDEGWEVSVAVGDDEIDVDVSRDAAEVLGTDSGGDLDDDERAALEAATSTLADAIRTALDEVGGTVDDVELDEEDDTVVWEVSIDDDVEVYVDVMTGEILEVDRT